MTREEREEIKRRSVERSEEEYDKIYQLLQENLEAIMKKKKYSYVFFSVYPKYVKRGPLWRYKLGRGYLILYFNDVFLHHAIKVRLCSNHFKIEEGDEYHFAITLK